jgi:hypothetical protein
MATEAAEPRKRRKYASEEREKILAAVDKVGVVEAARRHHRIPVLKGAGEELAASGVPDACGLVQARSDDAGTVGAERGAHHRCPMLDGRERACR